MRNLFWVKKLLPYLLSDLAVKRNIGQHAQHLVIHNQVPSEDVGDQSRDQSGEPEGGSNVREGSSSQQGGPVRCAGL